MLSIFQSAQHRSAGAAALGLAREIAATDIGRYEDASWLRSLSGECERNGGFRGKLR